MKRFVVAVCLSSLIAAPVLAQEIPAPIKKARCVACHAVDKKMIGPGYKDVAAKYKDNAEAPAKLFDKVRNGGAGVWGDIPMTPHGADKISDEDLKSSIAWILGL
jgi:cytochrome c